MSFWILRNSKRLSIDSERVENILLAIHNRRKIPQQFAVGNCLIKSKLLQIICCQDEAFDYSTCDSPEKARHMLGWEANMRMRDVVREMIRHEQQS